MKNIITFISEYIYKYKRKKYNGTLTDKQYDYIFSLPPRNRKPRVKNEKEKSS